MKGPGLRIEIDVRRSWRCPVCGQTQRMTLDITAARCNCVRDGVPMKLVGEKRPDRRHLRAELQAIVDRIQAGEEFPRMASPMSSDSEAASHEGGSHGGSRNRPPRTERSSGNRPPRGPRPEGLPSPSPSPMPAPEVVPASDANPAPPPPPTLAAMPPQVIPADVDDFGTGLTDSEPTTPR